MKGSSRFTAGGPIAVHSLKIPAIPIQGDSENLIGKNLCGTVSSIPRSLFSPLKTASANNSSSRTTSGLFTHRFSRTTSGLFTHCFCALTNVRFDAPMSTRGSMTTSACRLGCRSDIGLQQSRVAMEVMWPHGMDMLCRMQSTKDPRRPALRDVHP